MSQIRRPPLRHLRLSHIPSSFGDLSVKAGEGNELPAALLLEVRDISYIEDIYKDCSEFALAQVCTEQYHPVCAMVEAIKIDDISRKPIEVNYWQEFSNACKACILQEDEEKVIWYKDEECNTNI